ncbi:MAG: single-stranded DNA-binding protein [Erysipelotrichaceae bacterium]|nr:single-stranded DNA-binding protein [Erysipelotrichaceae bacterium]
MINNVVLTGRITELPKLRETSSGIKYATILLDIVRPFKNSNGIYDSDKISVTLWKGIAETANEICKIGDMLGVKGRIQTYSVEKETQTYYNYEIVAEHVSFMSV